MLHSCVFLGLLTACLAANIEKRDATGSDCYRCSRWDSTGNGYLPSDVPGQCSVYRQCYKAEGAPITGPIYRFCPPGTWTDFFDASNGNPCTVTTCDPDLCEDCEVQEPTTIVPILTCPYVQGTDEWYIDIVDAAGLTRPYGSCGVGGYFNDTDGVCTCTEMGDGCSCRVNIPLEFPYGINDVSCHSAWVGQTGLPAKVTVEAGGPGPVSPFSGVFQGFNPDQNNGGHISTYTLDGAFAGGWVYELTFAAWFKLDPSYGGERWGVLTMGDCADGPAFAIWVDNFKIQGHIELMQDQGIVDYVIESTNPVDLDTWYFVSVVYDSSSEQSLSLYVFTETQYSTCFVDPLNPFSCLQAAPAIGPLTGAVSPRGCGLTVGHTGSDNNQEMFKGRIAQVKVNQDSTNLFACV